MRGHGVEIEAHEVTARQRDEIRAEARKIARCAREYHKIERVRGSAMRADDGRANESQLRARVSVNIGGYMRARRRGERLEVRVNRVRPDTWQPRVDLLIGPAPQLGPRRGGRRERPSAATDKRERESGPSGMRHGLSSAQTASRIGLRVSKNGGAARGRAGAPGRGSTTARSRVARHGRGCFGAHRRRRMVAAVRSRGRSSISPRAARGRRRLPIRR